MSEFKKLFQAKRILALMLAAVMVVTMIPTTAFAAEVTDVNLEQSSEEVVASEETTEVVEEATEETSEVTEESMTEETTTEVVEEVVTTPVDEVPVMATDAAEGEAALATVLSMDLEEEDKTAVYTGTEVFVSLEALKNAVKVTVDEEEVVPAAEDLTVAWKVAGADGALTDLPEGTAAPVNAGTYKLTVQLAARDGMYKAAEIAGGVTFTITPAKVNVVPYVEDVTPGTKVADIKVLSAAVNATGATFNYVVDDPTTKDVDESKDSHIAITVSVRAAADTTKTALAADTVLLENGDYVMDFVASFTEAGKTAAANNYVVDAVAAQDVVMNNLVKSYVNVTPADAWKEAGKITHTYTSEKVAKPVSGTDFTAKVQYANGTDDKGETIFADIEGAQLVEEWYVLTGDREYVDAEGNVQNDWAWVKLEEEPANVGSYVYRLSYAGLDGVYAASYADVEVVIEPMQVIIKPTLTEGAVFYDEMTEADVLAQIDYQVFKPSDINNPIDVDKTTVWGTSYAEVYETQPYEPVFVLQYEGKDDAGNTAYVDNNGELLDSTKKYRVIFGGTKNVASYDGDIMSELPINAVVNTTSLNYNVATDYATVLSQHAVALTVTAGIETSIDITAITQARGNKGDSLTNVSSEVYDGEKLYALKEDYKKAVVKTKDGAEVVNADGEVVKDADPAIEYRWYKNSNDSITDYTFSEATNEPYGEDEENTFDENWYLYNGDGYTVPSDAGVYKLEITYKDAKKAEYRASTANVYYVIEKQPVKVALTGAYKALTGQTISEFFEDFYDTQYNTASIQKLSGTTWEAMDTELLGEDWYINYSVLETMLVQDTDAEGNPKTDAEGNPVMVPQTTGVYHDCDKDGGYYTALDAEGNAITEEDERSYSSWSGVEFKENAQYKLTATLHRYSSNYTDVTYVINDYTFKKTDPENPDKEITEVHKVRETESLNDKAPITVEKMGETALTIKVDEKKLGKAEKVYDGVPFDLAAFLGDAVSVVKMKEDGTEEVVSDVTLEYEWYGNVWREYNDSFDYAYLSEAVHVGTYQLYASFGGTTSYASIGETQIATVEITPAKLTVTPVITEEVVAGTTPDDICGNDDFQRNIVFDGVVEADKYAFTFDLGYRAFTDDQYDREYEHYYYVNFEVYDADKLPVDNDSVLRGDRTYTIKGNDELAGPYYQDYEVEFKEVSFTTVRGISNVKPTDEHLTSEYLTNEVKYDGDASASINIAFYEGFEQRITPLNAIPYSYYIDANGNKVYGNFLEVKIAVPAEYDDEIPTSAMYQNAIEAQGGIAKTGEGCIYVILDAATQEEKKFAIRWEDGYVENFTFDFTKAELMGNLAEAVAPKSIAFNSPVTQMAVGEEQALDLKLAKVQKNDILCISYAVDDNTILSVDDFGNVTALKEGVATVTAAPVKIVDGEKMIIQGAKVATVKITVKPVTAPKIKKVNALDDYAYVQYSAVADGYRREVYVLEGKNVSVATFDENIAKMNNGQWQGIFATAPEYFSPEKEYTDDKNNLCIKNKKGQLDRTTYEIAVYGLSSNTDYTVYVRNVSAVRKAENGNNVTLSAEGTTKGFTTTKVQVDALRAYMSDATPVDRNEDERADYYPDYYEAKLSDGKATVSVDGLFDAKELDATMDPGEYDWQPLPLVDATLQQTYVNPKLTYAVYSAQRQYSDECGDYVYVPETKYNAEKDEYEYVSTKLASVDKKGAVKFAGVGTVIVVVTDENTQETAWVELHITASADKVTGNKVKLSVGQSVALEDMLTYYEGNKKLTGNYARYVVRDEALLNAFAASEEFKLDLENGCVTAIAEGGKLEVDLTDYYVARNEGQATAKATLTSTALEPVKNLKIANAKNLKFPFATLANSYAYIQFTYEGGAEAFRIDVTDERGRTIRSSYVSRESMDRSWAIGKDDTLDKKKYYYWSIPGLTQQSKYNVTVTAMYDDIASKVAKTTVKTTKIPASIVRVLDGQKNAGERISVVTDYRNNSYISDGMISGNKLFVSGNTYTLYTCGNYEAEFTGSDSLTWTSSNKKVASIKANPGTYHATLKALRAGTTTIEVKSKITKEVISRYTVKVTSVGDAYAIGRRYFDDNAPGELDATQNIGSVELIEGYYSYVTVDAQSEEWIAYTAPKDGCYMFRLSDSSSKGMEVYSTLNADPVATNRGDYTYVALSAKQTVYIKLINNSTYAYNQGIAVNITPIQVADPGRDTVVPGDGDDIVISYTAKEDAVYEFTAKGAESCYMYVYDNPNVASSWVTSGKKNTMYSMTAGQTVYVKVSGDSENDTFTVKIAKFEPKQLSMETALDVTVDKEEVEWIEFTAPETNVYTFKAQKDEYDSDVYNYIRFYKTVGTDSSFKTWQFRSGEQTYEYAMQAGEKVYLNVQGGYSNYMADVTLSVSKLPVMSASQATTVSVGASEFKWYLFTAAEAGYYVFSTKKTDETSGSQLYLYDKKTGGNNLGDNSSSTGTVEVPCTLAAGQTVYVRVAGYNYAEANLELSTTKVTTEALAAATDAAVSLAASEVKYYEFAVAETGVYTYTVKPNAENAAANATITVSATKLSSNMNMTASASTTTREALLQAGEVVYLKVVNGSEASAFVLNVAKNTLPQLTETQPADVTTADAWVSFTAPEDNIYRFSTSYADPESYASNSIYYYKLDENGNYVSSYTSSYNDDPMVMEMELAAGTTIYWQVSRANYYPVTLNVGKMLHTLTLDNGIDISVPGNTETWFVFTAPSAGTYKFYSTSENDDDTKGTLYRSYGDYDEVNSADDDNGMQFEMYQDMEAGETLYLDVHAYSSGADSTIYVTQY